MGYNILVMNLGILFFSGILIIEFLVLDIFSLMDLLNELFKLLNVC